MAKLKACGNWSSAEIEPALLTDQGASAALGTYVLMVMGKGVGL